MSFSRVLYRARQFWFAWGTKPLNEEELAPARSSLTEEQMNLFKRLQPSEQIHALRVLQTIQLQGETDLDLQVAALLHDIGKARAPLKLWERVVIVLGKEFFPQRVQSWGAGQPHGWKRPFVIAEQHPAWGAEMASEVGTSPLAVSLIRRHQSNGPLSPATRQEDHLLCILQAADHQN
jgi:putative nucleotidyltransferase with HDIG domain